MIVTVVVLYYYVLCLNVTMHVECIYSYYINSRTPMGQLSGTCNYASLLVIDKLWLPRIYRSYTTLSSRA